MRSPPSLTSSLIALSCLSGRWYDNPAVPILTRSRREALGKNNSRDEYRHKHIGIYDVIKLFNANYLVITSAELYLW
ncbi:hypothetical protein EDWATA_00697 [Edwardsiella tarda ATCC 23685]|uniref:Uncharacterized protein n=1 Tax=Edwardsiella tarda ATCC 23685 TaxID=500638 RepID=D4F1V2_EDWTA|nr:hypothetical protein EDWATA_00697 [Edwardsiella tarda ATCC 23685]